MKKNHTNEILITTNMYMILLRSYISLSPINFALMFILSKSIIQVHHKLI